MTTFITIYFFIIGLCFGSFALATAWRIKKNKDFVKQRSECENCHHKLSASDLVPLFSWIFMRGKCRYCGNKLSALLPLAELTGGIFFGLSFFAWPYALNGVLAITGFVLWCVSLVLLLILFFYDLQWTILPNKVMYPLWAVSLIYALTNFAGHASWMFIVNILGAIAVSFGIFYVFFTVSKGTWIGYGDVRLGIAIGLLVSTPAKSAIVLFIASVVGILFSLPGLVTGSRKLASKIPFGPLLIIGLVFTMLYGQQLIDWYMHSILLL